jgi:hypothetical protein
MREFTDPKMVPFIEHSRNCTVDPDEVFQTVVTLCEDTWPINKGTITTKRGERHNSHEVTPVAIRNMMREFTKRKLPKWYMIGVVEWCRDKAHDMGLSLLNYLEKVQKKYFIARGLWKISEDDIDDEEETVITSPGVIDVVVAKRKRRSVANPAPRGFWSLRTVAKLAGCNESQVMKAIRTNQLVAEKRKGKWIFPKAAAEKWIDSVRLEVVAQ